MSLRPLTAALVLLALGMQAAPCQAEDPQPYDEWAQNLDDLMDEVRGTRRLRDRLAFLREAGQAVQRRADPSDDALKKLDELLACAPEGDLMDGILDALVADGSRQATEILLKSFDRDDYVNLKQRDLGEDAIAMRRRIVEFRLLAAADEAYLAVLEGSPPEVDSEVVDYLVEQVGSESAQRSRGAALLLGGWSVKAAGGPVLKAFGQHEDDSWTRAVLLEALGRTDPTLATDQILTSATGRDMSERLAALPLLGFLKSEEADKAIRKALKNKRWYLRRAAIEACDIRRDSATLGMLVTSLLKETPRLQKEIFKILDHATNNQLPHNPKDIPGWWTAVKDGFKAVPRGKALKVQGAMATRVREPKKYFTMTVDTDQVTIVFDTSGSMLEGRIKLKKDMKGRGGGVGTPFDITKQQIVGLVKSFPGKARFNLIAYSDDVRPFKKGLSKNSKGNLKGADKYLSKLKAAGETNLYDALALALSDSEVDTIFLLSDGAPNRGARVATRDILEGVQLANRFRKVKINTVQIGRHSILMEQLAKTNGGQYTLVKHMGAPK